MSLDLKNTFAGFNFPFCKTQNAKRETTLSAFTTHHSPLTTHQPILTLHVG